MKDDTFTALTIGLLIVALATAAVEAAFSEHNKQETHNEPTIEEAERSSWTSLDSGYISSVSINRC